MGNEAPPQFSADGNYWWDGEQWLPVDQLPRPLQGSTHAEYPALPDQRSPRRSSLLLLVAGILIVVLLVVVVGAMAATGRLSFLTGHRPTPAPTPSPTKTVQPTPTGTPVFIPGVTTQTILPLGRAQGLTCMDVSEDIPDVAGFCQVNAPGAEVKRIVIYGFTNQHVRMVRLVYREDVSHPNMHDAAAFLGAMAAFPYPGASPAQATAWVQAHVTDKAATTTIGGCVFRSRIESNGQRFVVDIAPV